MDLNLNPLDRLIAKAQTCNALIRRLKKLIASLDDPSLSREIRRGRFSSIQLASESLELQRHEIHCEAVALGIADPVSRRYGTKTIQTAFGHAVLFFRSPTEDPILTADPVPAKHTPLENLMAKHDQAGEVIEKAAEIIKEGMEEKTDGGLDKVTEPVKEKKKRADKQPPPVKPGEDDFPDNVKAAPGL